MAIWTIAPDNWILHQAERKGRLAGPSNHRSYEVLVHYDHTVLRYVQYLRVDITA